MLNEQSYNIDFDTSRRKLTSNNELVNMNS